MKLKCHQERNPINRQDASPHPGKGPHGATPWSEGRGWWLQTDCTQNPPGRCPRLMLGNLQEKNPPSPAPLRNASGGGVKWGMEKSQVCDGERQNMEKMRPF